MKKTSGAAVHAWLIWLKASEAVIRYASAEIRAAGLGDSDFRVLEVLLHKGPLPVNTIGPTVNLTAGSISVAVERLHRRGLVTRADTAGDRRVRMVELTRDGRELIGGVFQQHAETMSRLFSVLTPGELSELERMLKTVGMHARELWTAEASRAR